MFIIFHVNISYVEIMIYSPQKEMYRCMRNQSLTNSVVVTAHIVMYLHINIFIYKHIYYTFSQAYIIVSQEVRIRKIVFQQHKNSDKIYF